MEDYKKKYGDSMKKIEHLYESVNPECKQIIEYYFPELKESEDERIRKECISIIDAWDKSYRLQGDFCEVAPECIAWLEKQYFKKSEEDECIRKEILESIKGNICVIHKDKCISWLEKRGEQNHLSGEVNDEALQQQFQIWFDKGKCSGRDEVIFHPENFGLQKQGEQKSTDKVEPKKPAWSEENERMFTLCALSVKTRYNDGLLTCNEYEQVSLWLKSLKERMKGE